jgi:hypothetical protein
MIASVFGGWLGVRFLRSRAFALIADLVLLFASLALAGFFTGVMLGEGFLPLGVVPILFFAAAAIALLIAGIVLGNMLRTANAKPRARSKREEPGQAIVEHPPQPHSYANRFGTR